MLTWPRFNFSFILYPGWDLCTEPDCFTLPPCVRIQLPLLSLPVWLSDSSLFMKLCLIVALVSRVAEHLFVYSLANCAPLMAFLGVRTHPNPAFCFCFSLAYPTCQLPSPLALLTLEDHRSVIFLEYPQIEAYGFFLFLLMITYAFLNEFHVKDASSLQRVRASLCPSVPLAGKADLELSVTVLSAGLLQCENFIFSLRIGGDALSPYILSLKILLSDFNIFSWFYLKSYQCDA